MAKYKQTVSEEKPQAELKHLADIKLELFENPDAPDNGILIGVTTDSVGDWGPTVEEMEHILTAHMIYYLRFIPEQLLASVKASIMTRLSQELENFEFTENTQGTGS